MCILYVTCTISKYHLYMYIVYKNTWMGYKFLVHVHVIYEVCTCNHNNYDVQYNRPYLSLSVLVFPFIFDSGSVSVIINSSGIRIDVNDDVSALDVIFLPLK